MVVLVAMAMGVAHPAVWPRGALLDGIECSVETESSWSFWRYVVACGPVTAKKLLLLRLSVVLLDRALPFVL